MAQLPKIRRSNPVSDFQRVTPQAGGAFRVLAEMANDAYEFIKPAAIAEQQAAGAEAGREAARRQAGDNRVPLPGLPQSSRDGLSQVGSGADQTARVSSRGGDFKNRLVGMESGDNPFVVNSEGFTGKFQIGQPRLDDFNRANGTSFSTQDFLDPIRGEAIQERVFDWHVGDIDRFIDANGLDSAVGTNVGGVTITRDGLRAMAHLGGSTGMKRFVETGGRSNPADSNGTRLSDYARAFSNSTGSEGAEQIAADTMEALGIDRANAEEALNVAAVSSQGTTVRTKEGKTELRLFSPMSGEILQAHNAAAGVAYISERVNAGIEDLMNISFQMEGNPQGFRQAAEEYLRTMVEDAPDMFKEDLRADLSNEVQRRFLGMVDERHKEVRQRADNTSRALADRYAKDYSEALASGQQEEAAAARMKLEDVLFARESLPGVSWTRAQSENMLLGAMDDADKLMGQARKRQSDEIKDRLNVINDTAKDFRSASDEDILADPMVWDLHPDLALEAASRIAFRDTFPKFMSLPPAEMERQIAAEKARPVEEGFELSFLKPMEDALKASRAGLADDPISHAQQHFGATDIGAPPALNIEDAITNPPAFARAIQEREQFARMLQEGGFTRGMVPLSKQEATTLSTVLGPEQDPLARALLVDTMIRVAPEATVAALNQAEVDDNIKFGAGLSAATGDVILLKEALVGQEAIKAGQVSLPTGSRNMNVMAPQAAMAIGNVTGGAQVQARVMRFAESLYAANAAGVTDEADQKALMERSVQRALGQSTNAMGEVTGGVQQIGGFDTMLPPGVTAAEVEAAFGVSSKSSESASGAVARGPLGLISRIIAPETPAAENQGPPAGLTEASRWGGIPTFNGTPITAEAFESGRMRLVATEGPFYRLEFIGRGGSGVNVTQPNGAIFEFDLRKVIGRN